MAITSKGYTGSVDNVDWAKLTDKLGAEYSVFGPDAFRASAAPGDRAVYVSAGEASGQGILDLSDARVTLTSPAVQSGNRWDLIALRRNWSAKQTTLVMLQGGANSAVPGERRTIVGDVVDHPLYLARFTAGQTSVQEFLDLRIWHGNGGLVAASGGVLQFLDRVGTSVRFGEQRADRVFDALGMPTWRFVDETDRFERVSELGAGFEHYFGSGWNGLMVCRSGSIVTGGGALIKDPNGVGGTVPKGTAIARLPEDYRPVDKIATTSPEVELNSDGRLVLTVDAPVGKAVSCSFTFHRRNVPGL